MVKKSLCRLWHENPTSARFREGINQMNTTKIYTNWQNDVLSFDNFFKYENKINDVLQMYTAMGFSITEEIVDHMGFRKTNLCKRITTWNNYVRFANWQDYTALYESVETWGK